MLMSQCSYADVPDVLPILVPLKLSLVNSGGGGAGRRLYDWTEKLQLFGYSINWCWGGGSKTLSLFLIRL